MSKTPPTHSLSQLLQGVDGVLFDMDGVLLDTEKLYTQATLEVLGERAQDFTWEVKQKLMGRSPRQSAETLIHELELEFTVEEYLALKRPTLLSLFARCQEKDGAGNLVEELHHRGLPLAVATSSNREYFNVKSSRHRFFNRFQAVICGDDEQVKNYKPEPDIFIEAARRLQHDPSRCLVVEDSVAGVEAARRAGAGKVLAIIDERQDPREVSSADLTIFDYSELSF